MFNFFQPFETEVWLTFLIAYLVTAVTLWIVARVTPYEKRNPKAPPVYTLTSSLWFTFSSVFRGSNITPQVGHYIQHGRSFAWRYDSLSDLDFGVDHCH